MITRRPIRSQHSFSRFFSVKFSQYWDAGWPEEREIFNNKNTFLTWVNEEDQLRIISMQKGGDAKAVFDRFVSLLYLIEILMGLYRIDWPVGAVGECVKAECSKELMLDEKYGYIH